MAGDGEQPQRAAFEHAQVGLAVVAADATLVTANSAMTGILGHALSSVDSFPASVRHAFAAEPTPGPGTVRDVVTRGTRWSVIRSGTGWVVQAQAAGDGRPLADADLAGEDTRLAAIVDLHHDLASADFDVGDIVQWLVQRSSVLFGDSEAALGLVDGDSILYRVTIGGNRDLVIDNRTPLQDSMSGACVRTGATLVTYDVMTDSRAHVASARRAGLRSMIVVPASPR